MSELNFSAFADPNALAMIDEATARGDKLNFGWLAPDKRTAEQTENFAAFDASLPTFAISGQFTAANARYPLWQAGVKLLGKHLPYNWQQTGSCVGAGGGNMAKTTQCVEIVLKGENEEYKEIWWPFTYGCSRQRSGMRGRGEGSTGTGWAEAALQDGFFEIDPVGFPDLPNFQTQDGWIVQPSGIEYQWSAGEQIADVWRPLAKKHLFKTAARARSADDVIQGLINGYAATQASNFGFRNPQIKGDKFPVRIATWNGSWSHQTYIDEYWDHPEIGPIVRWGNNWGPGAHGAPTGDEPPGGVYISKETLDSIVKNGEVYIFSAFDGFPARELNWSAF